MLTVLTLCPRLESSASRRILTDLHRLTNIVAYLYPFLPRSGVTLFVRLEYGRSSFWVYIFQKNLIALSHNRNSRHQNNGPLT
jgi:hypothetical protein